MKKLTKEQGEKYLMHNISGISCLVLKASEWIKEAVKGELDKYQSEWDFLSAPSYERQRTLIEVRKATEDEEDEIEKFLEENEDVDLDSFEVNGTEFFFTHMGETGYFTTEV